MGDKPVLLTRLASIDSALQEIKTLVPEAMKKAVKDRVVLATELRDLQVALADPTQL
jgi:hypothetical protein